MRKKISILLAVIVWFSIVTQLYLMMQNRTASVTETIIRFFSFFTILTNILAAIYFTREIFQQRTFSKHGTLTSITVYITIVGIVYQVLLRHVWHPTGMQMVVDELLHTINPILVIIFWSVYEDKRSVRYKQTISWLLYPILYLAYILIRGTFSGFYPYPFVDVAKIGLIKTLVNSGLLLLFFIVISLLFVLFGKKLFKKNIIRKG
ncbi:MAG: Pr6Pr family membrane protein [Ginsengibacter sp.]